MSPDGINPFESPQASADADVTTADHKRPRSPRVFGYLGIVFGGLGALGCAMQLLMPTDPDAEVALAALGFSKTYLTVTNVIGIFFAAALLVVGVLLVRYRDLGRKGFNAYAIIGVIWGIGSIVYMLMNLDMSSANNPAVIGGVIGGIVGAMLGQVYPVLGLIFLNRFTVKQSLT